MGSHLRQVIEMPTGRIPRYHTREDLGDLFKQPGCGKMMLRKRIVTAFHDLQKAAVLMLATSMGFRVLTRPFLRRDPVPELVEDVLTEGWIIYSLDIE